MVLCAFTGRRKSGGGDSPDTRAAVGQRPFPAAQQQRPIVSGAGCSQKGSSSARVWNPSWQRARPPNQWPGISPSQSPLGQVLVPDLEFFFLYTVTFIIVFYSHRNSLGLWPDQNTLEPNPWDKGNWSGKGVRV